MPPRIIFFILLFCCLFRAGAQEDARVTQLLKQAEQIAQSHYDSALTICDEAIALSKKQNVTHQLALAYKLKGYCLYFKGNYPAALEYYQQAEKLAEEKGYNDVILSLHNLVGTFYKKQKRLKEALAEFSAGEQLAKKLNDAVQVANFKGDVGLVYELDDKLPEAIRNFEEALGIFKAHNDRGGMSYIYDYLGEAYATQGDFKKALEMMLLCLELRKGSGQQAPIAINLNNIGEIYILQKNYAAALPYLERSEKISAEIKYNDLRNHTLSLIAKCNYQMGNYRAAYDLFEYAVKIKDSIYNEKNAQIVNEMEAKYQNEKKELKIENLKRQNEAKEARLSKQRITIFLVIVVAALCGLGAIVMVRSNRRIRKAHQIISAQKHLVEEKQKEILDSIYYARRIQRSLLTSEQYILRHLKRMKEKA